LDGYHSNMTVKTKRRKLHAKQVRRKRSGISSTENNWLVCRTPTTKTILFVKKEIHPGPTRARARISEQVAGDRLPGEGVL
jgi:hypothetical protein